jgi:hypothetical protein
MRIFLGVHVDEDAIAGEALRAVDGRSIGMVEIADTVERHGADISLYIDRHRSAALIDMDNGPLLAVYDVLLLIVLGEPEHLSFLYRTKLFIKEFYFLISWKVHGKVTTLGGLYGEELLFLVDPYYLGVVPALNSEFPILPAESDLLGKTAHRGKMSFGMIDLRKFVLRAIPGFPDTEPPLFA